MNRQHVYPANVSDLYPLTQKSIFDALPMFPVTKKERRLLERMKEYFSEDFYRLPGTMYGAARAVDSKLFWRKASGTLTSKIQRSVNGCTLYEYFNKTPMLFGVDNKWAVNRVWVCKLLGEPYSEELFGPHWKPRW